ncbi:hypothetical protein GWK47_025414 [Chionoecetes opilio]|uniref:Uncharacterized protein n=1 Tax=Chionoecetes opilio TaxID=41210 RepID=A0A8J8WF88_CHIOP|nr:hypothetical protein GWK47_025414 [Chionoecetes opilio]
MAVVAMQAPQATRRPGMNVPRQVLDSFDTLVAMEDKKRTDAGMVILQHVDHQLREHGQGKEMPVGVKYIVQRLVSGLASTRLRAREGYFSTLCFLLRLHPAAFTPAFVLALLTKQKSAAMKAVNKDNYSDPPIPPDLLRLSLQEARDLLVAEMLLCGAVVRSGVAGQDPAVLQWVVNKLCAMRDKKSYMDITATQFLVNLMESCFN